MNELNKAVNDLLKTCDDISKNDLFRKTIFSIWHKNISHIIEFIFDNDDKTYYVSLSRKGFILLETRDRQEYHNTFNDLNSFGYTKLNKERLEI
jgi:hypothetical protein